MSTYSNIVRRSVTLLKSSTRQWNQNQRMTRYMSANCFEVPPSVNNTNDYYSTKENHNPISDLFVDATDVDSLISKSASIRRTFGPSSNAQAMLTLGGPSLAANASFDPHYHRAREWIHHHAVGPTVQSPVLIQGLIGALVEAAFPSSIIISNSMQNIRPLIVGVSLFFFKKKRNQKMRFQIFSPILRHFQKKNYLNSHFSNLTVPPLKKYFSWKWKHL